MRPRPTAAIFDMDGTLLDSERIYLDSFRAAEAALRVGADDALYLSMVGLGDARADAQMRAVLGDRAEAFIAFMRDDVAERFKAPVPLRPTARALLDALRGRPLAVATSTRIEAALPRLALAGLADMFEVVIGGDMVARGKPAPDIYLTAAEGLGIAPGDCVAFEDSEIGTQAALAAGMVTVQVPDMVPAQAPDAGQIVAADLMAGARLAGLL